MKHRRALPCLAALLPALALMGPGLFNPAAAGNGATSDQLAASPRTGPSSSPIAVAPDDKSVWVVNPDDDSVTWFEVRADGLRSRKQIRVGDEPTNLAISPDGKFVYVSNTASGTVSVIRTKGDSPRVVETIRVGTEPYGLAFTPNGKKLYVANARSNDVSVIDPGDNDVIRTIRDVGLEPRGVAVTDDGDGKDTDEKVYVTQFLGVDRPGVLIGRDDYKEGRVAVISVREDRVIEQIALAPLADTGFKSNGSALDRIAAVTPPAFGFVTGAFPNQLNAIAVKGNRAYVPNTAASPNGPLRFNVNVQAFLSVIDTRDDVEGTAGGTVQTFNMNRGINFEPAGANKVFFAVPWHVAFAHRSDAGYVVSAASNLVVKVDLDGDGTPTVRAPQQAGDPGAVVRIFVGQNPKGIAIDSRDRRAYVANEVSKDVSVIDLATNAVISTVRSVDLPAPGSDAANLLIGKALFHTSTGVNLPELGDLGVTAARLSNEGWSSCSACHPFGLTDNVVWIFGAGPRRTVPLNGSFNPHDPADAKVLNYSAIFDEVQDFENNIRGVSGGLGLITLADGVTPDPVLNAFNPANTGRSARLDLLADWVARRVRTPFSPLDADDNDVEKGRKLFARANCSACHGGGGWSASRRDYTPPPPAGDIVAGQVLRFLRPVGTFDPTAVNEIRQNGAAPLGAAGFNPPSLLGAGSMTPVLHNGSAITLEDVLENVTHRSAGTGGVDKLSRPRDRERLAAFVASIDATTRPFDITPLQTPSQAKAAQDDEDEATAAISAVALDPVRSPVRGAATIGFALPRAAVVNLAVYDVRGRQIITLWNGPRSAGRHAVTWNGTDSTARPAANGIYFVHLRTDAGALQTRKLVLAR